MSNGQICEINELLEEFEEDEDILAKMVSIFEEDCNERLVKLDEAVATGDAESIERQGHAIKGGVADFFAVESLETAGQLEQIGKSGELSDASETLATLKSQVLRLTQLLKDNCQPST